VNLLQDLFGIDEETEESYTPGEFSYRPDEFADKPMPLSVEVLQRLIPIRSFPSDELTAFAWSRTAEVFCPGSVLFRRDQLARYLFYLLDGVVRIEIDEHSSYEI